MIKLIIVAIPQNKNNYYIWLRNIGNVVITIHATIQFVIVVYGINGGWIIYGMYSQVIGPWVDTNALTNVIKNIMMKIWSIWESGKFKLKPINRQMSENRITIKPLNIKYLLP